jgi:hypothetical protein
MLAATTTRVQDHTSDAVNAAIRERTEQRVAEVAARGPEAIRRRLEELDYEWDIERTLEINFASVVLAGVALGGLVDRRWLLLPAVASGFMMQHVLQGWCPPVPVFRRLGVRTAREIEAERDALKALRGDFRNVQPTRQPSASVVGQAKTAAER